MSDRTMNPSPIAADGSPEYVPEPKQYPPGFLAIYMLKTEQPHAADMADFATTATPPAPAPAAVANVDDPTSGAPQNRTTPQANAFLSPADVVPPSAPSA